MKNDNAQELVRKNYRPEKGSYKVFMEVCVFSFFHLLYDGCSPILSTEKFL